MVADATRIVRTCQGCQFYARQTHLPAQALQTIPITWLFAVWVLDLVGPLQKAPGAYTHLLVAIDKFSKWIKVRPLNSIRSEQSGGVLHQHHPFNNAYPSPKDKSSCKKYTRGLAAIMQRLEPSWEMPFDKVSTSQLRWPTPLGLYAPAKGVNSTQGRRTCPLRLCKQYPSPGHLLCGVWTSSVP